MISFKIKNLKFKIFFWKALSPKGRLYFEVAIGAILVVLIPLVLASLQSPQKASAAWFDDNWAYNDKLVLI